MTAATAPQIASIMGAEVVRTKPLSGGSIGRVEIVFLDDGRRFIAKTRSAGLALEGWMLEELARQSDLPVPKVYFASDELLLMEELVSDGRLDALAQEHAADLLAALHAVTAPAYGLARDTPIGGLLQPNTQSQSWRQFFAEHRLVYMAGEATRAGHLTSETASRIETVAGRLDNWLDEPIRPSLIHGDMWDGNILCVPGRVSGFIDPAIYFGDSEIELAFATLFDTFGTPFFRRYAEHRAIAPGFFEVRRDLYNLYPLLVHTRLFGGSYEVQLRAILDRLGD